MTKMFGSSLPPVVCVCLTHIVLCFCFVFLYCLVYPMLPLSLDCLFLIAPSVFSNIYLINIYINFANIKTKTCWRGLYLISCPVLTSFFSIFILLYFFNIYESYIFLHIHILRYNGKLLQIKTSTSSYK